jgi:phospholipid transport system transporter-binding protein
VIEFKDQQCHVSGEINFENAQQVYLAGLALIEKQKSFPVTVNLAGLKSANTIALAVLVRWLRQTPEAKGLIFSAVPEKMLKIIDASHLTDHLRMV